MGTRSSVGVAAPLADYKGRYIHYDGYPDGVGKDLHRLVNRDGLATVLKVLTEDHYGWSGIEPERKEDFELSRGHDDGRFATVPGYGTAYTTVDNQSSPDEWVTAKDSWGTEWAYMLSESGIEVYDVVWNGLGKGDTFKRVGFVRYDQPGEAFDKIAEEAA